MEPNLAMVEAVLFPASVEFTEQDFIRASKDHTEEQSSPLTSLKQIKEVPSPRKSIWRIDGGDAMGSQFYAIPSFALRKPPLRIDLFLGNSNHFLAPGNTVNPSLLTKSSDVGSLEIAKHLVAGLDVWSARNPNLEAEYFSLPFGSKIVLQNVGRDINRFDFHFIPDSGVEQQYLSVSQLQGMWDLPSEKWPETVSLEALCLLEQIHGAISLVTISSSEGIEAAKPEKLYAFKSFVRDIPVSYHELKVLLVMDPHPSIMSRPSYIVTRKARFGGRKGVCGFLTEYHHHGSMQRVICDSQMGPVPILDKIRWAKDIVSGLIHINKSPVGFYSNLKLLNIVMKRDATDDSVISPVIIDFEQRSGGFCWSAPEVHYIDYLENRAIYSRREEIRLYYSELLKSYDPDWQAPYSTMEKERNQKKIYKNPEHGFSFAWKHLSRIERESAQVFMVGKLLWCIFENMPSPGSWPTYETFREKECEIIFPQFKNTPGQCRELIKSCTRGAPEWEGRWPGVIRRGKLLYPFGSASTISEPSGTADETRLAAKAWWEEQIARAERFLMIRRSQDQGVAITATDQEFISFMDQRLSLGEVLEFLEQYDYV